MNEVDVMGFRVATLRPLDHRRRPEPPPPDPVDDLTARIASTLHARGRDTTRARHVAEGMARMHAADGHAETGARAWCLICPPDAGPPYRDWKPGRWWLGHGIGWVDRYGEVSGT